MDEFNDVNFIDGIFKSVFGDVTSDGDKHQEGSLFTIDTEVFRESVVVTEPVVGFADGE